MEIKSRIVALLARENYTFSQLADYLHMTEDGLTLELNNKTLELRNLEAISKALKVPLYSFFRAEGESSGHHDKLYYINTLWKDDASRTRSDLEAEIDLLKKLLERRQEQLRQLGMAS